MIQLPGILRDKGQLADGTRKLELNLQECPSAQLFQIISLAGSYGWFSFDSEKIKEEDLNIPEELPEFKGEKTASQRLRNVIYVLWGQLGAKGSFEDFRKKHMEAIIEQYKEKLD